MLASGMAILELSLTGIITIQAPHRHVARNTTSSKFGGIPNFETVPKSPLVRSETLLGSLKTVCFDQLRRWINFQQNSAYQIARSSFELLSFFQGASSLSNLV